MSSPKKQSARRESKERKSSKKEEPTSFEYLKHNSHFREVIEKLVIPVLIDFPANVEGAEYRVGGGQAYKRILSIGAIRAMENMKSEIFDSITTFDWDVIAIAKNNAKVDLETAGTLFSSAIAFVKDEIATKFGYHKDELNKVGAKYGVALTGVEFFLEKMEGTNIVPTEEETDAMFAHWSFTTDQGKFPFFDLTNGIAVEASEMKRATLDEICLGFGFCTGGVKYIGLCDVFNKFGRIFNTTQATRFEHRFEKTYIRAIMAVNCAMTGQLNPHYYEAQQRVLEDDPASYNTYLKRTVDNFKILKEASRFKGMSKGGFILSLDRSVHDPNKQHYSYKLHLNSDPMMLPDGSDLIMRSHNFAVSRIASRDMSSLMAAKLSLKPVS
jgi:hypothetical protein